ILFINHPPSNYIFFYIPKKTVYQYPFIQIYLNLPKIHFNNPSLTFPLDFYIYHPYLQFVTSSYTIASSYTLQHSDNPDHYKHSSSQMDHSSDRTIPTQQG